MMSAAALAMLILAAVTASAQIPKYVGGFLPNGPEGYKLATLADLRSDDFRAQYNTVGITFLQPFDGALCCVVSVAEGFLSFGPTDASSQFVENFLGDQDTCTTGLMPKNTTLGVPTFMGPPYGGTWLSELSPKEQQSFRVTGSTPNATIASFCANPIAGYAGTAIFKYAPPYVIRPTGPNYPAPPASEYVAMSLADVQSPDFAAAYNSTGGILLTGIGSVNYCCMLHVTDGGWVVYSVPNSTYSPPYSPLSMLQAGSGVWACSIAYNNQIHWLGTQFGGPNPNLVFGTMNATIQQQLAVDPSDTTWDDCSAFPDTLTLYRHV